MAGLVDTHAHFDFLEGRTLRAAVVRTLARADVEVVAQTVLPSAFVALLDDADAVAALVGSAPLPRWSLGFHPWWIGSASQVESELEVFADAVGRTRCIGEIGLDFVPRRLEQASAARQVEVLRRILDVTTAAATQTGTEAPYVLSLHAVRSASVVLDLLEEVDVAAQNTVPILHRFGGTSDDLTRLVRLGGYLSVHPQLLESKRGRAYVQQVPAERLLLETDLPAGPVAAPASADAGATADSVAGELAATLFGTVRTLSELRGVEMRPVIEANQARVYR